MAVKRPCSSRLPTGFVILLIFVIKEGNFVDAYNLLLCTGKRSLTSLSSPKRRNELMSSKNINVRSRIDGACNKENTNKKVGFFKSTSLHYRNDSSDDLDEEITLRPITKAISVIKKQMQQKLEQLDNKNEIENKRRKTYEQEELHTKATEKKNRPDVHDSLPLIRKIIVSQLITLSIASLMTVMVLLFTKNSSDVVNLNLLHWNGADDTSKYFSSPPISLLIRIFEGIIATMPMIYLGSNIIEHSDKRDESYVNFSTTNMVMTLFGRRRQCRNSHYSIKTSQQDDEKKHIISNNDDHPILRTESSMMHTLPLALCIASVTGISEEIVFRGEVPLLLYQYFISSSSSLSLPIINNLPISTLAILPTLVCQAAIFGFGHYSSSTTMGENRVVMTHQTFNGLWYGLLYLMTGGDLVPCVIAHTLYDTHIFVETWHTVNNQIDYIEEQLMKDAKNFNRIDEEMNKGVIRHLLFDPSPSFAITSSTITTSSKLRKNEDIIISSLLQTISRFFYAFDYDHVRSLSRSDVQRAVSYAFVVDNHEQQQQQHQKISSSSSIDSRQSAFSRSIPKESDVNTLFDEVLKESHGYDDEEEERLSLTDFIKLLITLKNRDASVCSAAGVKKKDTDTEHEAFVINAFEN